MWKSLQSEMEQHHRETEQFIADILKELQSEIFPISLSMKQAQVYIPLQILREKNFLICK